MEAVPEMASAARASVRARGLGGVVRVLEGFSAELPLPKCDVVVHEIVGDMATEEGVAACVPASPEPPRGPPARPPSRKGPVRSKASGSLARESTVAEAE